MAKHTPGPWEYLPAAGGLCGAITTKTGWICDFIECPSTEDARLMAAAPELLEALEQLVMINKIYSEDKEHDFAWAEMQNAKQVIAKAKGEQCR